MTTSLTTRDEAAILATLARYSACADRVPDAQGWRSCFAEDAVVRIFSMGRKAPLVLSGLDTICHAFAGTTDPVPHIHLVTNSLIDIDKAWASIESCFVRLDLNDGVANVGSFGRYHDQAIRLEDGSWRLTVRNIHLLARRNSSSR